MLSKPRAPRHKASRNRQNNHTGPQRNHRHKAKTLPNSPIQRTSKLIHSQPSRSDPPITPHELSSNANNQILIDNEAVADAPTISQHPHNFIPSSFTLPNTLHIPRKDVMFNDSHSGCHFQRDLESDLTSLHPTGHSQTAFEANSLHFKDFQGLFTHTHHTAPSSAPPTTSATHTHHHQTTHTHPDHSHPSPILETSQDQSTVITPELLGGILQTYPFGDIYRNTNGPNSLLPLAHQLQHSPHPQTHHFYQHQLNIQAQGHQADQSQQNKSDKNHLSTHATVHQSLNASHTSHIPHEKRLKLSIGVSGGVDSLGSTLILAQWAQQHNKHVTEYWDQFGQHINAIVNPPNQYNADSPSSPSATRIATHPPTPTFPLNKDLLEHNIMVDIHGISVNHGLREAAHLETFYVKHFLETICKVPCDIINIHMQSYESGATGTAAAAATAGSAGGAVTPNGSKSAQNGDDLYFLLPSTLNHTPVASTTTTTIHSLPGELPTAPTRTSTTSPSTPDSTPLHPTTTTTTSEQDLPTPFQPKRFQFLINTSSLQSLSPHGTSPGSSTPSPSTILSNSTQDRARMLRYNAILNHCHEIGSAGVITGHHLQDQQETIFYRLLRGSGLSGLQGMDSLSPIFCFPIDQMYITPSPALTPAIPAPAAAPTPTPTSTLVQNQQHEAQPTSNPQQHPNSTPDHPPQGSLGPTVNSWLQRDRRHDRSDREEGSNYLPSHKFIPILRPMLHFTHRDMISTFIHITNQIFQQQQQEETLNTLTATTPTTASASLLQQSTPPPPPSLLNGWIEDPSNTDDHYDRIKIRRFLKAYLPIISNRFESQHNLATLIDQHVHGDLDAQTQGGSSDQSEQQPSPPTSAPNQSPTPAKIDPQVKSLLSTVDPSLGVDFIEMLSKQVHSIVTEFMSQHVVFNATLRQCTITIPLNTHNHHVMNSEANQDDKQMEDGSETSTSFLSPLHQLLPIPLSLFDQVLSRSIATLSNGTMQPQHTSVEGIRNTILQIASDKCVPKALEMAQSGSESVGDSSDSAENNKTATTTSRNPNRQQHQQQQQQHQPQPQVLPYSSEVNEFMANGLFMIDTTALEQRFNVTQVLGLQDCRIWSEVVFSYDPALTEQSNRQSNQSEHRQREDVYAPPTATTNHHGSEPPSHKSPNHVTHTPFDPTSLPRTFTKDSHTNLLRDPPLPRYLPTIPTHLAIHLTHTQPVANQSTPNQHAKNGSKSAKTAQAQVKPTQHDTSTNPPTLLFPPHLTSTPVTLQPDHNTIVTVFSSPPSQPHSTPSHSLLSLPFTTSRKHLLSSISSQVLNHYESHLATTLPPPSSASPAEMSALTQLATQFPSYHNRTITLNTFQCLSTTAPECDPTETVVINPTFYNTTLMSPYSRHLERSARRLTSLQPSLHLYQHTMHSPAPSAATPPSAITPATATTAQNEQHSTPGLVVQHFYPTKAYKWFW